MIRSISFEGDTWQGYEKLRTKDKSLHQALCRLLKEMQRGNPEPLRHGLSGLWSCRLSKKDRLIYRFDEERIYIFAIGGHYDD
ncbi:Txe/YoeB family addiction module toxin [Thioploca ingrica]|uniref:Putative mRNA interferase YoeB n=1 Tax=Thioploca ingrica TaxID=40754 RepID=A0A090ACH8_9GAMM|nr:Txe/YoeB family addiction module toxin [Thioploca ingrica]